MDEEKKNRRKKGNRRKKAELGEWSRTGLSLPVPDRAGALPLPTDSTFWAQNQAQTQCLNKFREAKLHLRGLY